MCRRAASVALGRSPRPYSPTAHLGVIGPFWCPSAPKTPEASHRVTRRLVCGRLGPSDGQAPAGEPSPGPYHPPMPNRLAGETSPYLLQHANNPVDWFPWGPDALARAKLLDRPIFLSIGYAACHWCHVMERESFEHEATARYLNDHFVAIKVDREERPDLDQLYMGAVQAMTGGGGWPMSVFLTPDGQPVLRRHLLPRRAAPRDAVVPPGPRGRRPGRGATSGPRSRAPATGWSARSSTQQRLEAGTDDPTPDLLEAVASGARCSRSTRATAAGAARRSSRSR